MDYSAQRYRDPATGRTRWAVLHGPTRCWYFPTGYGQSNAMAMARRLNRESRQAHINKLWAARDQQLGAGA